MIAKKQAANEHGVNPANDTREAEPEVVDEFRERFYSRGAAVEDPDDH